MKGKIIGISVVIILVSLFVIDAVIDKRNEKNYVKQYVEIVVKDYGTIEVELDSKNAPKTVENFLRLVEEGFYDGLTFHRIIEGFMIQGGDPLGDGTGGSDKTIKGEFKENGVNNKLTHKRGTISMARADDPNSASSQFFIMHQDSPGLDGKYAAFGKVTKGIDVVDKIAESVKVEDDNGTVLKKNQPQITSIKVINKDDSWETTPIKEKEN